MLFLQEPSGVHASIQLVVEVRVFMILTEGSFLLFSQDLDPFFVFFLLPYYLISVIFAALKHLT